VRFVWVRDLPSVVPDCEFVIARIKYTCNSIYEYKDLVKGKHPKRN